MSTELIINASLPETRIAMLDDGEIQEVLIERAQSKGITGNIYKGRVTRVLPGMQAAFVDIGLEKAAFLYVDDIYTHSEIWEDAEESHEEPNPLAEAGLTETAQSANAATEAGEGAMAPSGTSEGSVGASEMPTESPADSENDSLPGETLDAAYGLDTDLEGDDEDDGEGEDPVSMGSGPSDDSDNDNRGNRAPEGTIAPASSSETAESPRRESEGQENYGSSESSGESANDAQSAAGAGGAPGPETGQGGGRERFSRGRRGRRGGRFRKGRDRDQRGPSAGGGAPNGDSNRNQQNDDLKNEALPETYHSQVFETGETASDRTALSIGDEQTSGGADKQAQARTARAGFQQSRSRQRRIPSRSSFRQPRPQVNIQDLLQEGQEVIVQIAKDPIATKGARLTCHISLPGRHLVCMPTIDHVGVSRRIESDGERRRLRDFVERNRPKNLGFIVRTASGRQQSAEKQLKQDIDYLSKLWEEIREKAATVQAPALVYEDLNSVLRAIRDWVTEDIDKVIVDSRYHYNEILRFVSNFMPSLRQKVELYHGDIPIFDAYNISTELSRSLERKVWLKSGGYIVIDQAEAVVAIDVNTGRFVGKKNLEDTILKTNLEAAVEIAYQLRLRNCGGIIILDFIDMEREESRQRVYRTFEEALKKDRARPTIMKISDLGLVEMTRKRTRDTIIRTLCEPCLHCEGKGFIKSKQTVAFEALRQIERHGITRETSKILVQAHPDVIDILALDEREVLDSLERKYRKQIYLQAIADFHPEQFEVTPDREPSAERVLGYDRSPRDRQSYRSDRGSERGDRNGNDRHRRNRERHDRDRENRDRDRDRNRRSEGHQTRNQPSLPVPNSMVEGNIAAAATEGNVNPNSTAEMNAEGMSSMAAASVSPGEVGGSFNSDEVADSAGNAANFNPNSGGQGQNQGQSRFGRGRFNRGGRNRDQQRRSGYHQPQQPQSQSQGPYPTEPSGNSVNNDSSAANNPISGNAMSGGDDYSEEDRLAFLRAQAAQDAAIAKLGVAGQNASPSVGNTGGRGGQRHDRNQRGGRRGFPAGGGRGGQRNDRGFGSGKFGRGQRDQRRGSWGRPGQNGDSAGNTADSAAVAAPAYEGGNGDSGSSGGSEGSGSPGNE